MLLPHQTKTAAPNWFRRRSFAVLNSSVRALACLSHADIDHAFVNLREFCMSRELTTTKYSHEEWTHIFSVSIVIIPTHLLCQMQASSSGAELLSAVFKFSLLAEVSHDEAKMRERREVSLSFSLIIQKSLMHVQSCCFALSSNCFFYFLVAASS